MVKIVLTEFAKRHFDPTRAGTVITDHTPEEFKEKLDAKIANPSIQYGILQDGYAPFCKLVFMLNPTDAKTGTIPISPKNEDFLKCGYLARQDGELPVLTRWFESQAEDIPRATFLCIVLYDNEQLHAEGTEIGDAHYGIVSILGQLTAVEEPMSPITMMRNELGTDEGGSGHPLDRDAYAKSVEFWSKNAAIKVIS